VALSVFSQALAQQPLDLKWKLEMGKTFYQEMTSETKQQLDIAPKKIAQTQKQTFVMSFTPQLQDKEKNWVIKQRIEALKMNGPVGKVQVAFDSTKADVENTPHSRYFQGLVGAEFKFILSPEMKVVRVEGREAFLKKLSCPDQPVKLPLDLFITDDTLRQMVGSAFSALPVSAVKPGDTWTGHTEQQMGPIGGFDDTCRYTLLGTAEKNSRMARIRVDKTLKYAPPQGAAAKGLPFQIVGANLSGKGDGYVQFDIVRGRISESKLSEKLEGRVTIAVGGQNSDVKLSQTQTTTVRTSDEMPRP
jgi:hypothetical protein